MLLSIATRTHVHLEREIEREIELTCVSIVSIVFNGEQLYPERRAALAPEQVLGPLKGEKKNVESYHGKQT